MKGLILLFFIFYLPINTYAETVNKNESNFLSTRESYTVKMELGSIKLSLPSYYKRLKVPFGKDEPENNASFITGSVEKDKDIGANITIILWDLKNVPLCDTSEFQKKYLEKIKNAEQVSFEKMHYKWMDSEYGELFGVPMLRTTYIHPKDKYCRDTMFVKFCRVYTISFMADKGEFDKEWPVIEDCIKKIEFIDN